MKRLILVLLIFAGCNYNWEVKTVKEVVTEVTITTDGHVGTHTYVYSEHGDKVRIEYSEKEIIHPGDKVKAVWISPVKAEKETK